MELRTYILIDSMQPQYAALTGMLLKGDVPVEGMAELFVELAPASEVYEFLDCALKTIDVRPGTLSVEREFGSLEIHAPFQEAVRVAGREALAHFNLVDGLRLRFVEDFQRGAPQIQDRRVTFPVLPELRGFDAKADGVELEQAFVIRRSDGHTEFKDRGDGWRRHGTKYAFRDLLADATEVTAWCFHCPPHIIA